MTVLRKALKPKQLQSIQAILDKRREPRSRPPKRHKTTESRICYIGNTLVRCYLTVIDGKVTELEVTSRELISLKKKERATSKHQFGS